MHHTFSRRLAVLLAFGSLSLLLAGPLAARDDLHTERAVVDTLHKVCKAYEHSDADAMSELFTEDFTLTNSAGVVTTRTDDVNLARGKTVHYDKFEKKDMKARLHGDAAIVTGRTTVKGTSGKNSFSAEFQFTDTLVLQDGRWRVASSHVSILKSEVVQEQIGRAHV